MISGFYNLKIVEIISQNLCLQEVQNGRLFRLLAKLGTINERPE